MTGERLIVETIRQGYGGSPGGERQRLRDADVAIAALVAAAAAWWAAPVTGALAGTMAACAITACRRRPDLAVGAVLVVLGLVAGVRAEHARGSLAPDHLGPFTGWVTVVGDPAPAGSATRAIVEVDGERHEVWLRGRGAQQRARGWSGGDRLLVAGERVPLDDDRAARVAWQHVVAELRLDVVADRAPGSPMQRAANRVRALVARGAATLTAADAALYRGLVIGDDRDQPREMVDRFRASGLSHLTAVSGQNVAFVLAAAGPLLRRLRPWPRVVVTLGAIGWFAALTRFEPSILRAGAMAALSTVAFAIGRERAPARLLALAVIGLLLVDPLLVRSVGFALSVGATAGVTVVAPALERRLARAGRFAGPLAVTLGAQAGVLLPSTLVFGLPPVVSVPANLLAVPVAGAVMLVGLPLGMVAGAVAGPAPWLAAVLMAPVGAAVRWVDTIAALGARLEPGGAGTVAGWVLVAVGAAAIGRAGRRVRVTQGVSEV